MDVLVGIDPYDHIIPIIILCIVFYYTYRWAAGNITVFSVERMEEIVKQVRRRHPEDNLDLERFFEDVRSEFALQYPGHIVPQLEWIWCYAGGCLWAFASFHTSLTEYLMITGTSTGTSGSTGRHLATISDMVLAGNVVYSDEHSPFRQFSFKEGDLYHLAPLEAHSLQINGECWLLEYGRGCVPLFLPFGLAGHFLSTLDWVSVLRIFSLYARFMIPYFLKWPFTRINFPRSAKNDHV